MARYQPLGAIAEETEPSDTSSAQQSQKANEPLDRSKHGQQARKPPGGNPLPRRQETSGSGSPNNSTADYHRLLSDSDMSASHGKILPSSSGLTSTASLPSSQSQLPTVGSGTGLASESKRDGLQDGKDKDGKKQGDEKEVKDSKDDKQRVVTFDSKLQAADVSSSSSSGALASASGTRTRSSQHGQTVTSATASRNSQWENLQNLKSQLVDELTGTRTQTNVPGATRTKSRGKTDAPVPVVVPRGPPQFDKIPVENATKFTYDLASRSWQTQKVQVKIDTTPFSKGALRVVYHILDLSETSKQGVSYVAKISMDPRDNQDRDIYFKDVEMQSIAHYYAQQYNEYNPPKKVEFVKAWILQLDDREGAPLCGVERFIDGPYRKHNNNFGYVSDDERNTPQSFSHFTYESSNHQLLCVDIQGVSDLYTDPQVHSADNKGFGKGNMGQKGIAKFLQRHRCNAICRYLKLPPVNANYNEIGTMPVTRVMSYEHVEVVDITNFPLAQNTPLLSARTPLVNNSGNTTKPAATDKGGCCVIL